MNIRKSLLKLWNFWPPFLFCGIKIIKQSPDFRHITVKLKLRFWSANYVGTQYGGAMFSMTDPFYMIMLMKNLGSGYIVWDKEAHIRYLQPGRTDLTAQFDLSEEELASIRQIVEQQEKMNWVKKIVIKDKNGDVVADVVKTIYIKKKDNPNK